MIFFLHVLFLCALAPLTRLVTIHPSAQLITRSARDSTLGGIVKPICLSGLRLIGNSNFVGCSTGMSAGFAPFRILSTYIAARRNKSSKLVPVGHQTASIHIFRHRVNCRQPAFGRELYNLFSMSIEDGAPPA